jgi:hypothetical protein
MLWDWNYWTSIGWAIIKVTDKGSFQKDFHCKLFGLPKLNLQKSIKHNFVAHWQDAQCRLTMGDIPKDAILFHIDFVNNYTFQIENEI